MSTFEATIRVLGGLLSAHYPVTEPVLRPAIPESGREQYIAPRRSTRRRWARNSWLPIWGWLLPRPEHQQASQLIEST